MSYVSRRRLLLSTSAAAVGLSGLAGCSDDQGVVSKPKVVGEGSQSRYFPNLSAVGAEASVVVVGQPTGSVSVESADEAGLSGDKCSVSDLKIVSVIKGTVKPGSIVKVGQLGTLKDSVVPEELLDKANTYLLYLVPFEYAPGEATGEWTSVTLDAFYKRQDKGAPFVNASVHGRGQMPKSIAESSIRSESGI